MSAENKDLKTSQVINDNNLTAKETTASSTSTSLENPNSASWQNHQESTFSLGIDFLVWTRLILGKYLTALILVFVAIGIVVFNKNLRQTSNNYLKIITDFAHTQGLTLPRHNAILHVYTFCDAILDKILAWKGKFTLESLTWNEGYEVIRDEVLNSPQGSIIIGAHIGNLEILRALGQNSLSKNVNILIETKNSKKFLAYLKKTNVDSSLNFIPVEDTNPATMMLIDEKVKQGELVVILGDRLLTPESRSVTVSLLNQEVSLPQGPWIIAKLLKVPVYTLFSYKKSGKIYAHIDRFPQVIIRRNKTVEDITNYAQMYAHKMEEILLKAPCSWFNFYNYWHKQ